MPKDMAIRFFGAESSYSYPIFHLPPTYFGFNHVGVMNGIARSAVDGLKSLARDKNFPMIGTSLRDEPQAQYAVAKAEAMVEGNRLAVKDSFAALWSKGGRPPDRAARSSRECDEPSPSLPNVRSRRYNSAIARPAVRRFMNQCRLGELSGMSTPLQLT